MRDFRFRVLMKDITGARRWKTEIVTARNDLEARQKLDARLLRMVRRIHVALREGKPHGGAVVSKAGVDRDPEPKLGAKFSVRDVLAPYVLEVELAGAR